MLLSLERMRAVRDVDVHDDVMVVEAGVTLAAVHDAAKAVGRFFPLSLASEGSATVGGLISTNAGGTAVLRYGTMRDLVLGLEAVLPDGRVFQGLKRLRKDNTGYDLKQLLIGAEGTLGVVTAAALKLYPILTSRAVAIAGLDSPEAALDLLSQAKATSGGAVEAFELMGRRGVGLGDEEHPRHARAAGEPAALVRADRAGLGRARPGRGGDGAAPGAPRFETGLITDAAVAQNEAQARAFWGVRENQSAAQKPEGVTWKHDVSVPVSKVPGVPRAGRRGGDAHRARGPDHRLRPCRRRQHPLRRAAARGRRRRPPIRPCARPARAPSTTSSTGWAARSRPSTAWG